jgi:ubiquinol-cytochrome c reductase cytochrome c1 subunit
LNLALGVSVAGGLAVYTRLYGLPFVSEAHAMTMAEHGMHPPEWPFNHKAFLPVPSSFDHASIRRGFQVYREVCASCHSLKRVPWRRLVGVSHTADEIKAAAADVEYEDGPNDEGEMFTRPGKLADYLPSPYPNDEAARNGNAGALPPDLSLMILARHGGVVRLTMTSR